MRGVFAFLFVFVFIGAADAVQSCLSWEKVGGCWSELAGSGGSGEVDWSVECDETTFWGIAGCSVSEDSYVRASADEDLAQEVFCFCKVYAPFESGWQYVGYGYGYGWDGASGCHAYCASYCAEGFVTSGKGAANPDFWEDIMVPVK